MRVDQHDQRSDYDDDDATDDDHDLDATDDDHDHFDPVFGCDDPNLCDGDDGWGDAWNAQYDDDPSPYDGTYSED